MEEKPSCKECGKTDTTLTPDGICFVCLSKRHEEPDDTEGTWFNKA
jgi:hypothetical protein